MLDVPQPDPNPRTPMKHFLLFYDEVVDDYVARRAPLRQAHLELARSAKQRGELLLAGALAEPVDGAVLLFRGESAEVAEAFARADPFVTSGLVLRWRVREWTTVVGDQAAFPVDPAPAARPAVARVWSGVTAGGADAEAYVAFLTGRVLPSLERIAGHRGAQVLRRRTPGGEEFIVTTFWDSMDAVRAFAGDNPERAVVEPEARALLARFDPAVRHFEVERDSLPRGA